MSSPAAILAPRLAISAIFLVNGFFFGNWITRIPDVKRALGVTDGELGTALLALGLGALGAMLLSGSLIARHGSRRVVAAMAVAYSFTPFLPVAADHYLVLVGGLLLFGIGAGAVDVSMNAQAALLEQKAGRPIMSSFHAAYSLGGLIGAALGGLAAEAGIAPFAHMLAIAMGGLAVNLATLRHLFPDGPAPGGAEGPRLAWPTGALLPLAIVAFCCFLAEGAIADWSALYLREVLATDAGTAAAGYGAFSLAMTAGRFFGDRAVAAWGGRAVTRRGAALAAAGLVAALLLPWPPVAILGFGAVGLGLSNVVPVVFTQAARHGEAGRSIAAVSTLGYLGFLLGPSIIGWFAVATSLPAALGLVTALIVVAGLLARGGAPGAAPAAAAAETR
ncbi:MAG TPA: MFS transporter [Alphaproteobacteria bacterium]|nr:MFS transporter [Alphaproteobacteria bacterium]